MPNTSKLVDIDHVREKLIESMEQSLNHDGTGREMRFVGGDSPVIANGVTVQQWIPVSERLPEENKEVLAYRFTGCEVDSCVSHQKAYWSYDPVSEYPVTHWMPLPEPPKGE